MYVFVRRSLCEFQRFNTSPTGLIPIIKSITLPLAQLLMKHVLIAFKYEMLTLNLVCGGGVAYLIKRND